jgi:serine/threonine protein kinase
LQTIFRIDYYIVTEFLAAGDLRGLLENKVNPLGWKLRIQIAKGIIDGIGYLHSNDVIHRDIKTENVLMDHEHQWMPKVCDFGFARKSKDLAKGSRMTICGTEAYMAPELLFDEDYGSMADIFSYGVVLAAIITRINPDAVPKPGEFMYRSPPSKFKLNFEEIEAKAEAGYPGMLFELCTRCLAYEAADRPVASEISECLSNILEFIEEDEVPLPRFISKDTIKKPSFTIKSDGASELLLSPSDTTVMSTRMLLDPLDPLATKVKVSEFSSGGTSPTNAPTLRQTSSTDLGYTDSPRDSSRFDSIASEFSELHIDVEASTVFRNLEAELYKKKNSGFRNWRKRHFYLDDGHLLVGKKGKDGVEEKLLDIDLYNCAAVITPGLIMSKRFQIRTPSGTIEDFCALDHNQMLEWIDAINIASRYKKCFCGKRFLSGIASKTTCSGPCAAFVKVVSSKGLAIEIKDGKAVLAPATAPSPVSPTSTGSLTSSRDDMPSLTLGGGHLSKKSSGSSFGGGLVESLGGLMRKASVGDNRSERSSPTSPSSKPPPPPIPSTAPPPLKKSPSTSSDRPISSWLESIKLGSLGKAFVDKGYASVDLIKLAGGLKEDDLNFIGIENPMHRRILISESAKL